MNRMFFGVNRCTSCSNMCVTHHTAESHAHGVVCVAGDSHGVVVYERVRTAPLVVGLQVPLSKLHGSNAFR